MVERHLKILDLVNAEKKVEVTRLAEWLRVSQVTVRKDLGFLEDKGLLKREHGYAVKISSDDINNRMAFHYEQKQKIVRKAAQQVSNGETVMIESGSICSLLAYEIAHTKRDVTIITNSAFIASYIREAPYAKVVLLGGDYQVEAQVMVGPLTRLCAEQFFVDKFFVGTDGYTFRAGFTGANLMRTEAAQAMASRADQILVLTESSKFGQQSVVTQFQTDQVRTVITDDRIPAEIRVHLEKHGVEVQTVSLDS